MCRPYTGPTKGGYRARPRRTKNSADVQYQQRQVAVLKDIGDKSCMAGH